MSVICIKCAAEADDKDISVDVDTGEILCSGCDARYPVAEVKTAMVAWGSLIGWIEAWPGKSK